MWVAPTVLWFGLLVIEWTVPSIVGVDVDYHRVQFLRGFLQLPAVVWAGFAVRTRQDWSRVCCCSALCSELSPSFIER
jgi:hypothetical protein